MSNKERLSAFIDGELAHDELIESNLFQQIEQDQTTAEAWQNYHLIGDVLRGESTPQCWDIANQVALALENEPAHQASAFFQNQNIQNPSKTQGLQQEVTQVPLTEQSTTEQPTPQIAKRHLPAWLTQLGQIGLAACISLIAILGVQQYGNHQQQAHQVDQIPVLQTVPFSGSAEPVSLTRDAMKSPVSQTNLQEQRKRAHAMMQDYELQLRLNGDNEHLINSK